MVNGPKTQPVAKVHPFNRATIRKITGDRMAPASPSMIRYCEICRLIPPSFSMEDRAGPSESGPLAQAVRGLKEHVEVSSGFRILKCPVCGSLYRKDHKSHDLHAGMIVLKRMSGEEVFEMLLAMDVSVIQESRGKWYISCGAVR